MAEPGAKRRLTTILAADVEGYSRLMRADEEATLATLTTYREVIDGLIARHDGRIFSTGGDSVLAEFGSAVEAVRAAISIQEELKVRNAELAEGHQMNFRIGINVGDVMIKGEDLFGDGVNVAARLEGLAEPGGICISGSAYEQVESKLTIGFKDMGPQEVKNIDKPVSAFRLVPGSDGAASAPKQPALAAGRRGRAMAVAAAIVLIAIGAAGYWAWDNSRMPTVEAASVEKMAFPLPTEPSIAVLPFDNLTGDPDQDIMIDGLVESIITSLSQIPNLFVVARNSTFTYKGKAVKVSQVAEEMGVRYVLEGSVQLSGDKVRVTAQLIDAIAGRHVWAERYDRDLGDVFALQDDIAVEVVTAAEVKLVSGELARIRRGTTSSVEAYEIYLRGDQHYAFLTTEEVAIARQLFEEAVELDPNFAAAWSRLSRIYTWSGDRFMERDNALEEGERLARKAIELDDTFAGGYDALSYNLTQKGEYEMATAAGEKGMALAPNSDYSARNLARLANSTGRPEEAFTYIKRAMRLNPNYPQGYMGPLIVAYYMTGRYQEAIEVGLAQVSRSPNRYAGHRRLAIAYILAGQPENARAAAIEAKRLRPKFSIADHVSGADFKDSYPERLKLEVNAFRAAGVPEE